MPSGNARLVVEVVATSAQFQADLGKAAAVAAAQAKRIEKSINDLQAKVKNIGKDVAGAIGIPLTVGAGIALVAHAISEIAQKTLEGERALAQLDAVLKATGNSAGLTKKQLESLNESVQLKTVFDDDEIRKAETALLRFRKVQGDVFQDAIRLAPDVAAALGADLPTAAQALGRALSDPETGMKALRAAGINLSEQQKDLAARMTETGDRAGAQRIVLDELRKSVGGAGEANSQGLSGAVGRLNREWGDLQKAVGKKLFADPTSITVATSAVSLLKEKIEDTHFSFLTLLRDMFIPRAAPTILGIGVDSPGQKQRTAKGQITVNGLTPEEAKAKAGQRIQEIQDFLDESYEKEQIALRKRADGAAAFYHGELATQQKFLNEYNAQIEFGYGRGTVAVTDFFAQQRDAAQKSFGILDASITKQIDLQRAVIAAPSSNTDTREGARLKILQLVNQSTDARYARDLRIQQLQQQEIVAVERLKDVYTDLAIKVAEAQGDELTATRLSFQTSAAQQQRRQLETQATTGPAASQAEARAALENLARFEDIQLQKASDHIRHTVDDVKADLLELQGNVAGAARIRITNADDELRRQFAGRGDTASLGRLAEVERLKIAQADLNALQGGYNLAVEELGVIQGRVDLRLQQGAITELDSINQRAEAAARYADGLRPVVEAYEAIAKASGRTEDIVHAQQLRLELERLAAQADELRKKFQDVFVGAFTDNLTALVTGTKSLKDAVKDFDKSVVSSISNIASKNIGEYLFGKEGPLGGVSDLFAGFFGGGGKSKAPDITGGVALQAAGTTLTSSGTLLTTAGTTLSTAGTLMTSAAASLQAAAGALSSAAGASSFSGGGGIGSLFGGGGGSGADFAAVFDNPIGGLAGGTDSWRGGATWVGEHGPEILNIPKGAQVIPNDILRMRGMHTQSPSRVNNVSVTNNISIAGNATTKTANQTWGRSRPPCAARTGSQRMSLETFPDDIGATATAGPMFNTDVIELDSGSESRNANWAQARWKGECTIPAREIEKSQRFQAFFRAVAAGKFGKFRVRDWGDYQCPDGAGVGIFAMIDSTHFQAYKRYTFGSATHERKITRLRGTPTVTGGTVSAWDLDTGILTMSSGTPTAWAGEFDVPARLDTDEMQWHMVAQQGAKRPIIEWDNIAMIEVRE